MNVDATDGYFSVLTFEGMALLKNYLSGFSLPYSIFSKKVALGIYKPRDPLAHKGDFGHALLLAGSQGKMGAAVLAARACLCAGAGLLTTHIPGCGYSIMQTSLPEAMVSTDENELHLSKLEGKMDAFKSAGFGPGIGTHEDTISLLKYFLQHFSSPLVLDADALNIISQSPEMMSSIPSLTILTPHPKEFDRLFGESRTAQQRFQKAHQAVIQHEIIIVLKGHFTGVFLPDGKVSFNASGNAGMAKGGSGDVLTGIITALLAQGYSPENASRMGVYLHGAAGDLAASKYSEEAMLPTDLINGLGKIFLDWKKTKKEKK